MSLYSQFDERTRSNGPTIMTDASCANIVQAIGALLALGVPGSEVRDFCQQSLDTSLKLMAAVDPTKTTAENMDRVNAAAAAMKG